MLTKKHLFRLLLLLTVLSPLILLPRHVQAFTGAGTGIISDPYQITTCTQLQEISAELSAHYSLEATIDCTDSINWNAGAGFVPIGSILTTAFSGSIDGNNNVINSLYINSNDSYVGLFGGTSTTASIQYITLNTVSIQSTSADAVGGFVAAGDGNISNCHISGTVSGNNNVGGIAGNFSGYITNSSNSATVTGSDSVGGIVGYNLGIITNSSSAGSVNAFDEYSNNIGGVVGYSESDNAQITDNTSTAAVHGGQYSISVGGFIGSYEGSASVVRNTITGSPVIEGGTAVGGFIGTLFSGTIDQCDITVSTVTGTTQVGGFIGRTTGNVTSAAVVTNSSAIGTTAIGTTIVGGFIGELENQYGSVSDSSTTMTVSADSLFGPFYGVNNGGTLTGNIFPGETTIPVISASTVNSITTTGATLTATISDDGGAAISERGFVYSSTEVEPTTANSKLTVTGTTGVLTGNVSSLTEKTLYYARAFATNSNGTNYGTVVTFTTTEGLPAILKNVYFTFGKLRYGRYASPYQLRSGDYIYLKNYDPKKLQLISISLYDYTTKRNQGYTRTWRTSTSMYMRTNYLLPTKRKYAFIFKFKERSSGKMVTKYFLVNTISSTTIVK